MPNHAVPRIAAVLAVTAAGLGLAACGTSTVSSDQVEDGVKRQLAARGVELTKVTCEDDVEAKVHAPISCTGDRPSATPLRLRGEVTAIKDGKASYEVAVLIETGEIEATIARQFRAQGVPLEDVTCRDGVKAQVGARISCTALNPAETKLVLEGSVTAVQRDRGTFRVKAVRGIAKGPVIASRALAILEKRVGQKARGLVCPAEVPVPTTPSVVCVLTTQDGTRFDTTVTIDAENALNVEVARQPKG